MVKVEDLSLYDMQILYGMAKSLDLEKINFSKKLANGRSTRGNIGSQLLNFLPTVELWEAIDRDLNISRIQELHKAIDIFHIDYSKLLISKITDKGFGKLGIKKQYLMFYYFDGTQESYEEIKEKLIETVRDFSSRFIIETFTHDIRPEDERLFFKITDKSKTDFDGEYHVTNIGVDQYLVVDYSSSSFDSYNEQWLNEDLYEILNDDSFEIPFNEYKNSHISNYGLMLKDEVLRDFKRKDESLEVNND